MVFGLPSLDYLLSLPFLSFFLLPATLSMGSYATSLNFLFFYLTWITITWSHPPLAIEFFGTFAVRVVFYLTPSAVFLALDSLFPSISASFKALGGRGLPSRALRSKQYVVLQLIGFAVLNTLLGVAVQTAIDYFLTTVLNMQPSLKVSTFLPTPWVAVKHLCFAFAVRNVLAYYIHAYLLHSPKTSSILTRLHTTWQHGLVKTPVPFSAAYDHPATYLLRVWLPAYAPLLAVRMHILNYWLFLALVSLEEALAFSGYGSPGTSGSILMPSGVLVSGVARRQEAHFASAAKNGRVGNFGPWGVLDWLHGTRLPGATDIMDDLQAEASKRDVKGKANRAIDRVGDHVTDMIDDDDENNSDASPSGEEPARISGGARRRNGRATKAKR